MALNVLMIVDMHHGSQIFDSQLLAFARDIYVDHFGKEPKLEVTHGGLETAAIWEHLSWYGYDFYRS